MAAITPEAGSIKKMPFGDGWLVIGSLDLSGAAQADQWIDKTQTGLDRIISAQLAAGKGTGSPRFCLTLNARGTGVAEGTNPGDLGFEATTDTGNFMTFMIYGIGPRRSM